MSWLSDALNRNHLGVVNAIGGPLVNAAGSVAKSIPVVGGIVQAAQDYGNLIPDPFKNAAPVSGGGSGAPSLSGAASWLTGNNGLNALGVLQGLNAAQLGAKSSDYANQAKDIATQRWQQGAPLRARGAAGLATPQPINLGALDAQRMVGNPFARPVPLGNG